MESLPPNKGRESCNNGWYNETMKEISGTTKQPVAHIDPGPWFLPSSVLRVRMILLKFTVAFENESKLLVESWSCDLSSNLVGSKSPLSLCLKTLWFYAFQVSGRLEPAKVVERENIYDQQVRNCRGLATWTVEQKKTQQLFLQWFVFHFQLFMLRKTKKLEKGMLLVQHLRPSLILGAFDPWNPTGTPSSEIPQTLPVSRQLGATGKSKSFTRVFFCLTMEGECPEQSTDLAGLWGREGYARFEAQWDYGERKKSQWKVCCHGFS